jgi:hypothetical protein
VQVGSLTATTGPDGSYTLKGVPRGKQQVRLSAPGFRYISLSVEAFQPAERPVTVTVEKDTRRDWGLMQGFLTPTLSIGIVWRRPVMNRSLPTIIVALALLTLASIPAGFRPGSASSPAAQRGRVLFDETHGVVSDAWHGRYSIDEAYRDWAERLRQKGYEVAANRTSPLTLSLRPGDVRLGKFPHPPRASLGLRDRRPGHVDR